MGLLILLIFCYKIVAIVTVTVISVAVSVAFVVAVVIDRCCRCRLHCRCLLSPSWRRSNGGAAMGREGGGAAMAMATQQWQWVDVVPINGIGLPPPCPTTIARPLSPRHLVRDLDLVVAPRPPSSVATAATAVFLLSPHLPHFLIVVSIVPPPTCDSDVVVKARCTSLPRAWPAGRSHPIPTPALRGAPPPT